VIKLFRRGISNDELNNALTVSYRHAASVGGAPADDNQIQKELREIKTRASRVKGQGRDDLDLRARHLVHWRVAWRASAVVVVAVALVFFVIGVLPHLHDSDLGASAATVTAVALPAFFLLRIAPLLAERAFLWLKDRAESQEDARKGRPRQVSYRSSQSWRLSSQDDGSYLPHWDLGHNVSHAGHSSHADYRHADDSHGDHGSYGDDGSNADDDGSHY